MVHYEFMKPENLKDKDDIHKHVEDKYGVEFTGALLKEGNTTIFDYIKEKIGETKIEDKLNALILHGEEGKGINSIPNVIKALVSVIGNAENYVNDLYSAIFMGLLFNEPETDSVGKLLSIKRQKGESDKDYIKRKQKIMQLQQEREEIFTVWRSKDSSIDKDSARENYPIPILEYIGDEHEIEGIPGGCYEYHRTMISKKNIVVFDTRKEITHYARYCFMKMHNVYQELKESSVDNLLLMEFSLGIGYVNQIYCYVRNFKQMDKMRAIAELVSCGASIIPFFIRKQVVKVVWDYLKNNHYSESALDNALALMKCVKSMITDVFTDCLELWWYTYFCYSTKDCLCYMYIALKTGWNNYFSEEIVYDDWLKLCGINDWRGITRVEDCFTCVKGYKHYVMNHNELRQINWTAYKKLYGLPVTDIDGNQRCISIEMAKNQIGEKILERVSERLGQVEFPKENKDLYKLYYRTRKKVFEEWYKEEQEIFNDMDVIITNSTKSVKQSHVYAVLQKQVIYTLLLQK